MCGRRERRVSRNAAQGAWCRWAVRGNRRRTTPQLVREGRYVRAGILDFQESAVLTSSCPALVSLLSGPSQREMWTDSLVRLHQAAGKLPGRSEQEKLRGTEREIRGDSSSERLRLGRGVGTSGPRRNVSQPRHAIRHSPVAWRKPPTSTTNTRVPKQTALGTSEIEKGS